MWSDVKDTSNSSLIYSPPPGPAHLGDILLSKLRPQSYLNWVFLQPGQKIKRKTSSNLEDILILISLISKAVHNKMSQ